MACCGEGLRAFFRTPATKSPERAVGPTLLSGRRTATRKLSLPKPDYKGMGRRNVSVHSADSQQLSEHYDLGDKKGAGAFGVVRFATMKQSGRSCVIKTTDKNAIAEEAFRFIANEIEILSFCDHPNIVRLYHTFEDEELVHCAMQLCRGGELAERLNQEGSFPEDDVKVVMRQLLRGVHHLHSVCCIAHRDLKLENIMLKSEAPISENKVKIIDFGFAQGFKPGMLSFDEFCGTAGYLAPEILTDSRYDEKCDIFSCGAMLYKMMCNELPFPVHKADSLTEAFDGDFFKGRLRFKEHEWEWASEQVKVLARDMCHAASRNRHTAESALQCDWLEEEQVEKDDDALEQAVRRAGKRRITENLKKESSGKIKVDLSEAETGEPEVDEDSPLLRQLCREALRHVVYNLEDHDLDEEQRLFEILDKDGDGLLMKEEIFGLCRCLGMQHDEALLLMESLDADLSGIVSYTDFLRIAIAGRCCDKKALLASFSAFDHDKNGKISFAEMKKVFSNSLSDQECQQLLEEVDQDGDGEVDFEEFLAVLPCTSECASKHDQDGPGGSSTTS